MRLLRPIFQAIACLLQKRPDTSDRSLLIQPLPGIGDMVWHLPCIHSLAAASPGGQISILTKPRSRADVLLAGDDKVDQVLWLERNPGRHDGLGGFFRLVGDLRRQAFSRVWIAHDSHRYAWAAYLAGIPERRGYGQGIQHCLLSHPIVLQPGDLKKHPIELADLMLQHYAIAKVEDEPVLYVSRTARQRVEGILSEAVAPAIAIGIGSSEAVKQWGAQRFSELCITLGGGGKYRLLLIGGPAEQQMADEIISVAGATGVSIIPAIGLPIDDTAAVLAGCQLYVGNDTGFLNMSSALGVNSIGLFGGSPPLTHSCRLHCLQPADGQSGMQSITADQVTEMVEELINS